MQKVKITKYKKIVIIASLSIFAVLMAVVTIKPELIINFLVEQSFTRKVIDKFKSDESAQKKDLNDSENDTQTVDKEPEEEIIPTEELLVEKKGDVLELSIVLDEPTKLAAAELYLLVEDLEIGEIKCRSGFECVKSEVDEVMSEKSGNLVKRLSIVMLKTPESIEEVNDEVLLASVEYTGSGKIEVLTDSFYATLDKEALYFINKEYIID